MKLSIVDGTRFRGDKIVYIKTENEGPVMGEKATIFKVALLCNQLAWNEVGRYSSLLGADDLAAKEEVKAGDLWFKQAVVEAINHAEKGINWAEPYARRWVEEWCKKYRLKWEAVDKELERMKQRGLWEWEVDSTPSSSKSGSR